MSEPAMSIWGRSWAIGVLAAALGATLFVHEFTTVDILLQDRFFDFHTHRWLVDKRAFLPRLVFYTGPKAAMIALGVVLIGRLGFHAARRRPWTIKERRVLFLLLSMALVPATIAIWKQLSGVFCPAELVRYGGRHAMRTLFESRPEGQAIGHCFPAAHASGGFAFMALYFMFDRPRWRVSGLLTGLLLGGVMGLYQMLKGAHFLTHTLATLFTAALLILWLARLLNVAEIPAASMPTSRAHPGPMLTRG